MDTKLFHYISKEKVEMLQSQLCERTSSLSTITTKLNLGVLSTEIEFDRRKNEEKSIYRALCELNDVLLSRGLTKTLDSCNLRNNDTFLHDKSVWHHDLFYFRNMVSDLVVTYLASKTIGDEIIILVGSPNNLIGKAIVEKGVLVPGSGPAYIAILRFFNNILRTEEPRAVNLSGKIPEFVKKKYKEIEPLELARRDVAIRSVTGEELTCENAMLLDHPSIRDKNVSVFSPQEWELGDIFNFGNPAYSAACFYLKHLVGFPQSDLEVMFKVYSTLDIESEKDGVLKKLNDTDLPSGNRRVNQSIRKEADRLGLWKFKHVYIGSPIYVAYC